MRRIQERTFRLMNIFQIGMVRNHFDPVLQRRRAIIADHDRDASEIEARPQPASRDNLRQHLKAPHLQKKFVKADQGEGVRIRRGKRVTPVRLAEAE